VELVAAVGIITGDAADVLFDVAEVIVASVDEDVVVDIIIVVCSSSLVYTPSKPKTKSAKNSTNAKYTTVCLGLLRGLLLLELRRPLELMEPAIIVVIRDTFSRLLVVVVVSVELFTDMLLHNTIVQPSLLIVEVKNL
jgi:hypothetical protein